jgi:hypothetical protein
MTELAFGSGTLIGQRTDVKAPPSLLGILSGVTIVFERESLLAYSGTGAGAAAIAGASGKLTIKGTAKAARMQTTGLANLFFGPTCLTMPGQLQLATGENDTVPGDLEVTVANASTFQGDLGVFYANSGIQLVPVAADPDLGEYVLAAPGVYQFNAHDEAQALTFFYSYAVATKQSLFVSNEMAGGVPFFEVFLQNAGGSSPGLGETTFLRLNNCFSTRLALPFVNARYTISDFDFQAIGDTSNQLAQFALAE